MSSEINETDAAFLMRQDESRLILRMVQDFSTWEPFQQSLRRQLNLIGIFLRTWLRSKFAFHFFTNPNINRVHWMLIGNDESQIDNWTEEKGLCIKELTSIEEIHKGDLKVLAHKIAECSKISEPNKFSFLLLPFSQHDFPFGHFVLVFETKLPNDFLLEKVKGTINVLQNHLRFLIYNHYPITSFTYLPSFQTPMTPEAAILFCDIRNSTEMFEIARMTEDDKYTNMIVIFLKHFLEYASKIISVPNIGRIHRFMGDGFLATFGEHLTVDPPIKAKAACSLVLLTAKLLVQGFEKLWATAQDHELNKKYLGSYNEDLDLRLGVGVNYGQIRFDFFGITMEYPTPGQLPRGFYDFTAVGDHMNFASRLCSVASQPISSINIAYRSEELPKSRLTAPIISSRTIIYHNKDCFRGGDKKDKNPLLFYRTDFGHKGKGHPMPGFEIWPHCIDTYHLLKILAGIHNNHFHNELEREVTIEELNNRPKLNETSQNLKKNLDDLLN